MANIVEIIIKGIDRTKDGFTGAIKNASDLEKRIDQVKPFFLGLAATALGAGVAMGKAFINSADEASKMAQKVGMSVEQLTALSYAADLSGASAEVLKTGFKTLSEDIQNGGQKLEAFGISLSDTSGALKSNGDLFLEVADKISKMEDGAEKTAAAVRLFGKSGQDLIPLLNSGSDGIRQMTNEAAEFGQVISTDTAKQAEQFNDNLSRMKAMCMGVVNTVTAEFLPALVELTEALIKMARESGFFQGLINTLIDLGKVAKFSFDVIVKGLKGVGDAFVLTGNLIGSFVSNVVDGFALIGSSLGNFAAAAWEYMRGNFDVGKQAFDAAVSEMQTRFVAFKAGFSDTAAQVASDWTKMIGNLSQPVQWPILRAFVDQDPPPAIDPGEQKVSVKKTIATTRIDSTPQELEKMAAKALENGEKLRALQDEIANRGLTGEAALIAKEQERYEKQLQRLDKLGADEDEYYATRAAAAEAFEQRITEIKTTEEERRQSLLNELRLDAAGTDFERFQIQGQMQWDERMKQISALNLSEEQAIEAVRLAQKARVNQTMMFNRQMTDATVTTLGQFASLAQALGKKNLGAYKAISIAQATIAAITGATRAFADHAWPMSAIISAGVLAAGMANVAQIQSMEGAAHGGLEYVPNEATYLLDKGERVLSPKQNEDMTEMAQNFNEGRGGGQMISLTINLDGRPLWQGITDASRNGELTIDARSII